MSLLSLDPLSWPWPRPEDDDTLCLRCGGEEDARAVEAVAPREPERTGILIWRLDFNKNILSVSLDLFIRSDIGILQRPLNGQIRFQIVNWEWNVNINTSDLLLPPDCLGLTGSMWAVICLARLEAVELNRRLAGDRVTLRDLQRNYIGWKYIWSDVKQYYYALVPED